MPRWVYVLNRIISGVGIAVKGLWVAGIWDDGVRGYEAAEVGIILKG